MMKLIKMPSVMDRALQVFLKAHDVDLENDRMDMLQKRLMVALDHTPQEAFAPVHPTRFSVRPFPVYRAATMGLALLMLGVFVGRQIEPLSVQQKVAAVSSEQKVSVLAMATPWGEWIEEGE